MAHQDPLDPGLLQWLGQQEVASWQETMIISKLDNLLDIRFEWDGHDHRGFDKLNWPSYADILPRSHYSLRKLTEEGKEVLKKVKNITDTYETIVKDLREEVSNRLRELDITINSEFEQFIYLLPEKYYQPQKPRMTLIVYTPKNSLLGQILSSDPNKEIRVVVSPNPFKPK